MKFLGKMSLQGVDPQKRSPDLREGEKRASFQKFGGLERLLRHGDINTVSRTIDLTRQIALRSKSEPLIAHAFRQDVWMFVILGDLKGEKVSKS